MIHMRHSNINSCAHTGFQNELVNAKERERERTCASMCVWIGCRYISIHVLLFHVRMLSCISVCQFVETFTSSISYTLCKIVYMLMHILKFYGELCSKKGIYNCCCCRLFPPMMIRCAATSLKDRLHHTKNTPKYTRTHQYPHSHGPFLKLKVCEYTVFDQKHVFNAIYMRKYCVRCLLFIMCTCVRREKKLNEFSLCMLMPIP